MKTNLKRTDKAFLLMCKELAGYVEAMLEPVDNCIDAPNCKNIYITFNKSEHSFTVHDDGACMSKEDLKSYCEDFIFHKENGTVNPIGLKGQGSKICPIVIGKTSDGEQCELKITCKSRDTNIIPYSQSLYFTESNDGDSITQGQIDTYVKKDEIRAIPFGMTYKVFNCVDDIFSEDCIERFKAACTDIYGLIHYNKKINIYINDGNGFEEISYYDYMYLEELGDKINSDGLYNIKGKWFKIMTHVYTNKDGEVLSFKTVSLFIPRETVDRKHMNKKYNGDCDGDMTRTGIYSFRGNRLMNKGGNIPEMFGRGCVTAFNTGGNNRCRLAIKTDSDTRNILGIGTNKNLGIRSLFDNVNTYSNFKNSDGYTVYEVIKREFRNLVSLNIHNREVKEGNDGKSKKKKYNKIEEKDAYFYLMNCDIDKRIVLSRKEGRKFFIDRDEYDSIEPKSIIDEICFKENVSPVLKSLLYLLLDTLQKDKVTTRKCEKVIVDFYNVIKKKYNGFDERVLVESETA